MKRAQLLKIIAFTLLGIGALSIPFSQLLGANVTFTLYDFIVPSLGSILGTGIGIVTVLLTQFVHIALSGNQLTFASVVRMITPLFAVFYFSKKSRFHILIPFLAMIAFNLHPIGKSAWQYSLLWLIPQVAYFYRRNIFLRSLGATFTAHAVGGAIWVWAFGMSKNIWLALIPQTLMERLAMATGITLSYALFNWMTSVKWVKVFKRSFRLTLSG